MFESLLNAPAMVRVALVGEAMKPANASALWITEIYNIAFRKLQYGPASAFSVILFIIMLALGYFYVKALTANAPRREG